LKVLYVEDELFLAKIVKESLESRGFQVVMESDGAKILSLFKKELPDACVLDIMLPNCFFGLFKISSAAFLSQ
jgi:DNA-binding response OmpR family regulator